MAARNFGFRFASTIEWAFAKWIASRAPVSGAFSTVSTASSNGAALTRTPSNSTKRKSGMTGGPIRCDQPPICVQESAQVHVTTILGFILTASVGPDLSHLTRVIARPSQTIGQIAVISRCREETSDAILDQFRQRSNPARYHRRASGISLQD